MIAALVTQAVDRLHTKAGSLDPVEVYGTVLTQRCERCEERYGLPEAGALHGGLLGRGAALHHPRLRLPPAARGHALGRDPAAGGRRAGLGARRRRRRLHRARLGPAHGADLAAALGPAHPGRAAGARRRDPHPVRPLRPPGHPRPERGDHRRRRRPDRARARERAGAASASTARRRSSPGPPRGSGRSSPTRSPTPAARCVLAARREQELERAAEAIVARGGRAVARAGRPARPRPRRGPGGRGARGLRPARRGRPERGRLHDRGRRRGGPGRLRRRPGGQRDRPDGAGLRGRPRR